jgi:UDP:flavonoid glycosyltransferase YjiC (YdhE family)
MLIVPYSHDQPDNASRMVRLGVAKTMRRRAYSATSAAAALRELLEDPAYAARAAEASTVVQRENGASVAADVMESVLARS